MKTGKEVTIYDLARVLNISPSTVSRGLKDNPIIRKFSPTSLINKLKSIQSYNQSNIVLKHNLIIRNSTLRKVNVRT
jgi:DNA-binding LacI/PurR family transcriptional regulator